MTKQTQNSIRQAVPAAIPTQENLLHEAAHPETGNDSAARLSIDLQIAWVNLLATVLEGISTLAALSPFVLEHEPPPAQATHSPVPDSSPEPDRLEPPNYLWWQGKRYAISTSKSRRVWDLLRYLWEREAATFEELCGPGKPWPDPVSDSAYSTLVGRINLTLPTGYPWRLKTGNRSIYWEKSQENHSK